MADQKCPSCGAELKPEVLGGLCPKCVLGKVIEEQHEPLGEQVGDRIGRYKLLQKLDEGACGVVWMAEQTEPIRRQVAIKVIKPGMDSAYVLARFEAERQALALMDHPNIAKVFDTGATAGGRPYFVMELVKGALPITRFCDETRLSLRERLELFIQVCQGVQHAHTKGIVHRDLKPGNVLVALYDGKPVPKIIDFGIFKALGPRLMDPDFTLTIVTQLGSVVGTLNYLSPEQAEMNQLDIDTRSDIYSLGALLYQLLTGTIPLTHEALGQPAFHEIFLRIRQEEPPTPSLRLSICADRLPAISAQRKLQPKELTKTVRGKLDWIVMKALDKDRYRRYETANAFALDIAHYLNGEPVLAGPPTACCRLKKLVLRSWRNSVTLFSVGTTLIGVALAMFLIFRWVAEQRIAERLRGEIAARLVSRTLSSRFAQQEVRARQLLRTLAILIEVHQQNQQECEHIFTNILGLYPEYQEIGAVKTDGTRLVKAGHQVTLNGIDWFRQAAAERDFWPALEVGPTGASWLGIAFPATNSQGEVSAVVYIAMSVNQLFESAISELPYSPIVKSSGRRTYVCLFEPGGRTYVSAGYGGDEVKRILANFNLSAQKMGWAGGDYPQRGLAGY